MAAQWYQTHLGGAARVLLITNDRENKRKAIEEGISAETSKIFFPVILESHYWVCYLHDSDIAYQHCHCHDYLLELLCGHNLLVNCFLVFS